MKIQPGAGYALSYAAARPVASAGPMDSVQLSGQNASMSHARMLEARGVKFQYMGRGIDFWNEKWKDAPAEKCLKFSQDGTEVQFQIPGFAWTALKSPETLGLVFAFHGGGQLDTLENPQLAANLQKLKLKDGSGHPVAPWEAYRRLSAGQSVGKLTSAEDVALEVFLTTGQAPPDLKDPARAKTLQSLSDYTLSSGDLQASYRSLPAEVTISAYGETMGTWKTDQPVDLQGLKEQRERYEALCRELGQDQARPVWRLLASDDSQAPYAERLELYRATRNEQLYAEAAPSLERSPAKDRFLANLKELQDVTLSERVTRLPAEADEVVLKARPEWTAEGDWTPDATGWKDNPAGKYRPDQNASLTSRPISLQNARRAELSFGADWSLERDRDKVKVEVREVGGSSWSTLHTFTDRGSSPGMVLDLGRFLNKEIELRFQITTDCNDEREGFALRNLEVKADGKTLLSHRNGGGRDEVLAELERPGTDAALLGRFLQDFPNTHEGLTAWRSLGGSPSADQARALSGLSQELGTRTAVTIWPDLTRGAGTWDERKQPAVAAYQLATELAEARGSEDVARAYEAVKVLPDEALEATRELLSESRGAAWQGTGSWGYDRAQKAWSTNPGRPTYPANCKDSLVGPTLDLTGRQGCSLRYDARWEFEEKHDFVTLQASTDGQTWTDLRSFQNQADWTRQTLSLGAYDGKKVQLRWHLTTDGSREYAGLSFKNLGVYASGQEPIYLDRPEKPGETGELLWERIEKQDSSTLIQAARMKDIGANEALRLQPVLASAGNRTAEVEALVRNLGLDAALPQASLVIGGRSAAEVGAAYRTARNLSEALGSPVDPKLPGQMLAAGFDSSLSPELETLAKSFNVFEPGSRWVRRPDGAMDDSPNANYRPNEDSSLVVRSVDLKGLTSPRLCYESMHALEETHDHVHVEVDDGSGWKALAVHENSSGWQSYSRDLSAYKDKTVRLRFRLTSDGSRELDGMALRKLSVRGLSSAGQEEVRLQDFGPRADGLELLSRSVFRPGQDRATLKVALETLGMLTEGLGDPGQALSVWDMAGADPSKARDLGLLVHYAGWEQSRMLWFVLKDLPDEQRTRKAELLALGAQLAERGVDAFKAQQLLEASDLDSEALGALVRLSSAAGEGAWQTTGSWARVQTPHGPGWSDSPNGNYQANQNTTLTNLALDLRQARSAKLRYQATYATEQNHDKINVQASRDGGKTWDTLAIHTGTSGWSAFEHDLTPYAGGSLGLRFQLLTDGSQENEGITLAHLAVLDESGKEVYADRGGAEVMNEVLELACDTRSPLEARKKAMAVLAGMPNGIGWRALAMLREEEKAGRLKGLSLPVLIQRLPAALVSDDLNAALVRIIKEGASTGILEEEDAIRVGGVRMKRR